MLWRETMKLWCFGLFKIPMIFWVRPKVLELTKDHARVKICFSRRTKNHLNSMYFGVLAVGADIAGGIQVMNILQNDIRKISFVFKDFQAQFLKRPEADVHFVCEDGLKIANRIEKALQTGERENVQVQITAFTPTLQSEPVASFILTLSLKRREGK